MSNVIKQTEPVLLELSNWLKWFESLSNLNEEEWLQLIATLSDDPNRWIEDEYILRGLVFEGDKDIDKLKKDGAYKINIRNILGVKHSEDWIFNLNIGNVMHLAGMTLDELSFPEDLSHELNKDAMLEKIILVCTAYFCLGTEYWFLSLPNTDLKKQKPMFSRSESDMWHA